MKIIKCAFFCILASTSSSLSANIIANGSFDNCDFNNWNRYVDETIQTTNGNEFTTVADTSGCYASINVDYNTIGGSQNTNEINTNILSTEVDLSGGGILSFDLATLSEFYNPTQTLSPIPDSYFIALQNGNGGYYDENGNFGQLVSSQDITEDPVFSSFSFELSNTFDTSVNWYLEFVVNKGKQNGAESDNFGSSLLIDNVRLIPVNEPGTLVLFAIAFGLLLRKRLTA